MLRTSRMYVEHYVSTSCVLYVPEIFKFSNGHFFTHMFTYVRNVRTNGKIDVGVLFGTELPSSTSTLFFRK
jgi:hypothetical protein